MLKIEQMKIKASLSENSCRMLAEELGKEFPLLLYGTRKSLAERLGLSPGGDESFLGEILVPTGLDLAGGDMIHTGSGGILYYKIPEAMDCIEAGFIGEKDAGELSPLLDKIAALLPAPGEEAAWQSTLALAPSYLTLREGSRKITPPAGEMSASRLLQDRGMREFLQAVKDKDPVFSGDLQAAVKVENFEDTISALQEGGLIGTDHSLLCNKTGQQILKVSDRSSLEDLAQKGFKCFVCGASIGDEKVVRTISCTDLGKRMISGDYWLVLMVLDALYGLGFTPGRLFFSSENGQADSLFMDVNNEAIMVRICSRKPSLDDAYLISAQAAAYGLKHIIAVSPGPVSILMKSHLREASPSCRIDFVESLEGLSPAIKNILTARELERISQIAEELNELTPIPVDDLIMKKVVPDGITPPSPGLEKNQSSAARPGDRQGQKGGKKKKKAGNGQGDDQNDLTDGMEMEILAQENEGEVLKELEKTAASQRK